MKDISLGEGLRFAFPGVAFYAYLYLLFPEEASRFASATGIIGFPLTLTVIGSGVYFIYRPLLYDVIFEWIINRYTLTPRRELMERYGISFRDAMSLFARVRDKYLVHHYPSRTLIDSSGIHMTYQAGILAFAMAGLGLGHGYTGRGLFLLALGIIALASGFLNDAGYERRERDILVQEVNWEKIDPLVVQLGYKKT